MPTSSTTILVVEDSPPFRRWLLSMLQKMPEVRVVCEVSDGEEAVAKAPELQPDLIILDIGLPKLNGIDAAIQIRQCSPKSKLLFLSQENSIDIVQVAFAAGALGYVVKTDAGRYLMTAVNAVLRGARYVSGGLVGHDFEHSWRPSATPRNEFLASPERMRPTPIENRGRHEVVLYSDDRSLINQIMQFVGPALEAGHSAVIVATEQHRDSLLSHSRAHGLDIGAAVERGRYIAVDAAETISTFMVNGMLDPVRFMEAVGNLIQAATIAAKGEHPRVAFFGEGANLLWAEGKVQAAIQDEELCNQVTKMYAMDILCGYSLRNVEGMMHDHTFQRICADHSAVYSQ